MDTWEMKRVIRDAAMRRVLLKILQEATEDYREGFPGIEPMLDDEEVVKELHRILKIKKGLFR